MHDPEHWDATVAERFPPVAGSVVNVSRFLRFLELRMGRYGRPVSERVGAPMKMMEGWFRCPWLDFNSDPLPTHTLAGEAEWATAWHGCKLEGLYSIMYNGEITSSCNESEGHRFFEDAPGIYVHHDSTAYKADHYIRFIPLFQDGVFWAAKWELRVNRAERVIVTNAGGPKKKKKKTDQWVQKEGSVHLEALWLCGRLYEDMEEGVSFMEAWNPLLEANPRTSVGD